MNSKRYGLLLILFLLLASGVAGQNRDSLRRAMLDSILAARYYKTPYDTNYIIRPEGRLTLKVRLNQSGNTFHAKGTVRDRSSRADLRTSHKTTFAVAAIYRGLSAGLAVNPAKLGGFYKDYEMNVNYFSSRLSLDASYQRSTTLAGDIEYGNEDKRMESGDVAMKMLNVVGYYIFNHRRFSYSAAFTQSYIQRRSAGSWLAGFSYQGGSIKTTEDLKERAPNVPETRIYLGHFGIGGGYAYNWVVGKKWLFHFSMLPTFVVYNRNNMTVNGETRKAKHTRFNMIFNERAAIVYNFSPRYFSSLTLAMNNSVFDNDDVLVNQNKWRLRASFGLRL